MFNVPIPPPPLPIHREPLDIENRHTSLKEKIEECEMNCEDKNVRRN